MVKQGCENVSALLILLIIYLKKLQKSNISLDNKNLEWGKYHYEINVFLKYTLDTIIGTPRISWVKYLCHQHVTIQLFLEYEHGNLQKKL